MKLAQSCQSAPTALVTGKTERSSRTRDAGQQTSEMQMMPTATVTETVWTFSEPDAAISTTELGPTDEPSSGKEEQCTVITLEKYIEHVTTPGATSSATAVCEVVLDDSEAPHPTEPTSPAAADEDRSITKDDDETCVAASIRLSTTDMYEDWSAPFAAAEKVRIHIVVLVTAQWPCDSNVCKFLNHSCNILFTFFFN